MPREESSEVVAVMMTAPDAEVAERLGHTLVEERLAACANVIPAIVSVYRWEGEVQRDGEAMIILKTTPDRQEALQRRAVEIHPYDVPEVLMVPVSAGHPAYLSWVAEQVG